MAPDPKSDPIVHSRYVGGPTGEGTEYETASGVRWRSNMYGGVSRGGTHGRIVGEGKFGPFYVVPK